jgi:hypothetical protein
LDLCTVIFPKKCILLAKPDRVELAQKIFKGTSVDIQTDGSKDSGVEIITTGTRHLGAAVGTEDFKCSYVKKKVDAWIQCVKTLSGIASSEPHAVYAAYTHCLQSQWTFLCHTMPGNPELFMRSKMPFRQVLIPSLLHREVNDLERDLLSSWRMGGMGITKPTEECLNANSNSVYVSTPLVRLVKRQEFELDPSDLCAK